MTILSEIENYQDIVLLVNGEEAFQRITKRIRGSKESIHIKMFIWRDDKIGNQLLKELIIAADRGVKVHISKDKLGSIFEKAEENKQSLFHKEFSWGLLFKAFICDKFYPMKGKAKSSKQEKNKLVDILLNHPNITVDKDEIKRDHSKYYIFDNKILFIGGINIEDKEVYTDVEGKKYYDYMVELESKVFVEKFKSRVNNGAAFSEEDVIEFIFNVKNKEKKIFEAKKNILKILSSADKSVDIVMAYFGDGDIRDKIIEIVNKGISVTIILPERANIQDDLNKKFLKQIMIRTGNKVKVYLSKNMVHAKLVRIDKRLFTLGSINLNKQAMENLLELNILINCEYYRLNSVLDESIENIINNSKEVKDSSDIKYNILKAFLEKIIC